jgi:glycosyltransferase involved in cell wall biosynthesis
VQKELEARGWAVDVLVHRDFPDDLARETGYVPVFSSGAYDFGPPTGVLGQLRFLEARSVQFASELRDALRKLDASRYALLFSHTLSDFELIGWRRIAHELPSHARVMLLLRNTLRFRDANRLKVALHPYWRIRPSNLKRIHAALGTRFVLATDSEPLTEDYATAYAGSIVTLPIPINDHVLRLPRATKNGGMLTLGYLGDARASKGFPQLPALVRHVLDARGDRVRFAIQCPPSASGSDSDLPSGVLEMRALASADPHRIELIEKKLSEAEYAQLLGRMDIVLIPYRRYGYVEPTSGICAEAAALGKPVVVPSGTWMSRELGRYGGGVEFDETRDDLQQKAVELIDSYDTFRSRAADFATQWQTFHNAANVAARILSGSGLAF